MPSQKEALAEIARLRRIKRGGQAQLLERKKKVEIIDKKYIKFCYPKQASFLLKMAKEKKFTSHKIGNSFFYERSEIEKFLPKELLSEISPNRLKNQRSERIVRILAERLNKQVPYVEKRGELRAKAMAAGLNKRLPEDD